MTVFYKYHSVAPKNWLREHPHSLLFSLSHYCAASTNVVDIYAAAGQSVLLSNNLHFQVYKYDLSGLRHVACSD